LNSFSSAAEREREKERERERREKSPRAKYLSTFQLPTTITSQTHKEEKKKPNQIPQTFLSPPISQENTIFIAEAAAVMDSLSSVSPSIVLPHSSTPLLRRHVKIPLSITPHRNRSLSSSLSAAGWRRKDAWESSCKAVGGGDPGDGDGGDASDDVEVDRALRLDGTIPGSADEFVKQVSSRAYDMRRHLHESLDSSSYDGIIRPLFLSLFEVFA